MFLAARQSLGRRKWQRFEQSLRKDYPDNRVLQRMLAGSEPNNPAAGAEGVPNRSGKG